MDTMEIALTRYDRETFNAEEWAKAWTEHPNKDVRAHYERSKKEKLYNPALQIDESAPLFLLTPKAV